MDRLILEQLTEMEEVVKLGELAERLAPHGLGLAAVRSLLASNADRFAYHERRWIPASRLSSPGRTMSGVIESILRAYGGEGGGPMPLALLVKEIAFVRPEPAEEVATIVERMLSKDERFILFDGKVALTEWSFVADDETLDRALDLNGVSHEEFDSLSSKLAGIDFRLPGAVADAIAKSAPVSLKALGAVVWASVNRQDSRSTLIYDSRAFFVEAVSAAGHVLGSDGILHPDTDVKKWVTAAVKLSEKIAPSIDIEDAMPIEMKADDIATIAKSIVATTGGVTATKLLEDRYEITPSNKTFPDDLANIMAALKARPELQWVGGDRFQKAGQAPDYIYAVPEPFHFTASDVLDEDGEPVDVELVDDGLSSTLRKLLSHPLATDVLDEDIQPAPKTMPETLRLVLKSIHRELGTFPLCQVPTGWLDPEPDIQELIVQDPAGRELQVWVNLKDRLMYGWLEWWFEQAIESGAVFTLTKTSKPNVLEFEWMDQPDPVVYISNQRMEELRAIGAEAEGKSTLDLLIEAMSHWPKGADYLTLLAEVNVIRRSSRRLIASLLSSYQCFYQRSGSPVWHFDAKKVEQGFDKTKKKFAKK